MGRYPTVEHDFYCINCGKKGMPLARKTGKQKEKFHRKRLYCLNCKTEVNHIECRNQEEVETFKLIDEQWILLFVSCILNRLFQVIHIPEVLFPRLIYVNKGNSLAYSLYKLLTFRLIGFINIQSDIENLKPSKEVNSLLSKYVGLSL